MNLLLLEPEDLMATGDALLTGRRAHHVRAVLKATVGSRVRAGLLGGALGHAVVLRDDAHGVLVHAELDDPAPARPRDALLLAVPRPKVLKRVLEDAAAMGFAKVALVRSWRVDKSHLGSRALGDAEVREHLLLGLEQGRRTHLPEVAVFPLFKPFVEDHLEAWATPAARFVAHPGSSLGAAPFGDQGFTLAVGPEGGWVTYELEQLEQRGFQPCSLGMHPLRVEAALAAAWAVLAIAREVK